MNLNKIAFGASAAILALSPAAAFAGSDSGRLSAEVNIPHMCSIGGDYHMDLTGNVSPGQGNVRRADSNALEVAQNGATTWTLTQLEVAQTPNDSVLHWATGIGVDFQNRGSSAAVFAAPTREDHLVSNVADNGRRTIDYQGAFSGRVTVMANIDENTQTYNPLTGSFESAPLLGGERYLIRTRLRCTATQFNESPQ